MKISRLHVIKIARTALLALIFCAASAFAAPLRIAVVLSEQGGAYKEYASALGAELAGRNVALSVLEYGMPLPETDLVIAAGMKAGMSVAATKPAAMLVVLVPREGYARLLKDFPAQAKDAGTTYSAIYLDQPLKRQLDLIAALLPKAASIGVLYSTPPAELGALRSLSAARKFRLNERSLASASNMSTALQELLTGSDVLLALPDTEIYNASTIRNILLATYRNQVPLIGISPGYVKAGALSAVFSTPEQIAAQSAAIVQDFSEKGVLPAAQYAKAFEVAVNEHVARSLGLTIRSLALIRAEIGAAP